MRNFYFMNFFSKARLSAVSGVTRGLSQEGKHC